MKEKVIFFGSGSYIIPVIETLNKNFDLVLVITNEEENGKVFAYCRDNNLEVYSVSTLDKGIISTIDKLNVKIAVLASFGLIIPAEVLNLFEFGIINIHPSLLPLYRGPTPVQSAILDGKVETGVSIIKLDSEVDHGEILAQQKIKIEPNDTSDSLYTKLFKIGSEIIVSNLSGYISGKLRLQKQDHKKATFTKHLTRNLGFIDFQNPPKREVLNRMIRAYYPWPSVWFKAKLNGNERSIKLLPEQNIQVEGRNVMSFKDFTNGYSEGKEILDKLLS